jgi:hypothetical protein
MITNHLIPYLKSEIERYQLSLEIAERFKDVLSADVEFSPVCYITITVKNRQDLVHLMELAQIWKKTSGGDAICYKAEVKGHGITIIARDSALPDTCKLVEELVELPAEPAKPARKEYIKVLKCDL